MADIQALVDERANLINQAREVLDRIEADNRAEDRETYDRMNSRLDELDGDIDRVQALTEREARYAAVNRPGFATDAPFVAADSNAVDSAFDAYLRFGQAGLTADQAAILAPRNAGATNPGSAGGYTVPTKFEAEVIKAAEDASVFEGIAQVITTDGGETIQWPTFDERLVEGHTIAENTADTELDPGWGTAALGATMVSSGITRQSIQLLQDSSVDLETFLPQILGERVERREATNIAAVLAAGVTTGKVGTVTTDNLIDLQESVGAYGKGKTAFVLNPADRAALRKLKDGQGRYVWEPAVVAGTPSVLLGSDAEFDAKVAAGVVYFGDWKRGLVIRHVRGIAVQVYRELYMPNLQVGFQAYRRTGAVVQHTGALKALRSA